MPTARLQSMYTEMVLLMRKLYQECRLVHGDLSEYNILVNDVSLRPTDKFIFSCTFSFSQNIPLAPSEA